MRRKAEVSVADSHGDWRIRRHLFLERGDLVFQPLARLFVGLV